MVHFDTILPLHGKRSHSHRQGMTLYGRDDCVACDGATPVCNCSKGEQCVLTSRTCSQCPAIQCIKGSSSSGGINPGIIAGPVVAVLVIASLALFWFLRRKKRRDLARLEELAARARKAESAGFHLSQPSSPHPPSAHSGSRTGSHRSFNPSQLPAPPPSASRRSPLPPAKLNAEYYDEQGAHVRVYRGNGTINVDRDPFADGGSFSTGGSSMSTQIIPIQSSNDRSEAARKLNAARENLLNPKNGHGAPMRPARSPDLDLRLNPTPDARSPGGGLGVSASHIRDSYLSGNSSAPSFISGMSYDVHNDAPKIMTSKQVQIGRLQQAEVVQIGRSEQLAHTLGVRQTQRSPSSPGGSTFGHQQLMSREEEGDEEEEGLYGAGSGIAREGEPTSASTDLRFSMGSLAYRDSISTTSTGRYLTKQPGHDQSYSQTYLSSPNVPLPRLPQSQAEPRESMFSTKSYADSLLGTFPMIPPSQHVPPLPSGGIPQSSSAATLGGMGGIGGVSRPPTAFKGIGGGGGASRPMTGVSMADSFLGTFPFVPPNMDDLAELPSAGLPSAAVPETGKR